MEEPLELETAPETGVRGIRVARDPRGLYVTEAPKSLRVHQGDRLVSARVFFEGVPPAAVEQVLGSLGGCRVSLCVRRPPAATTGPLGGTAGPPGGTGEEHPGKVARLSIPILTPSKKPPAAPGAPAGVEFALPKLSKLLKSRSATEPAPSAPVPTPVPVSEEPKRQRAAPGRLTVKEAASGKTGRVERLPVPRGSAADQPVPGGSLLPAVEVAIPGVPAVGATPAAAAAPPSPEPPLRLPRLEVALPGTPQPEAPGESPRVERQEGESPGKGRKGKGSPGERARSPAGDEGGAVGTRRGFGAIRVPSLDIAVPSAAVELLPELQQPGGDPGQAGGRPRGEEEPVIRPSSGGAPIGIALPRLGLAPPDGDGDGATPGATPGMPDLAARFTRGLQKLSLELETAAALPGVEIGLPETPPRGFSPLPPTGGKTKPSKFTLPRFALSLPKPGGDGEGQPPAPRAVPSDLALGTGGARVKLKVPKLSLAPFGAKGEEESAGGKPTWLGTGVSVGRDEGKAAEPGTPGLRVPLVGITLPGTGGRRVPSLPQLPSGPELGWGVKLGKFGGSSPDLRAWGVPKALRRGGSAESLILAGRKRQESPGAVRWVLKNSGVTGGGERPSSPRFTVPSVGFSLQPAGPGSWKTPKATGLAAWKVPALELAPPGLDELEETSKNEILKEEVSLLDLPKPSPGLAEGGGRRRRRKVGGVKAAMAVLVKPREKGEARWVLGPRPHGEAEAETRRRRWVPRVGFSPPPESPVARPKARFPTVELSPGDPRVTQGPGGAQIPPLFNLGGEGTPKFQLPKLALSPQPCGEW